MRYYKNYKNTARANYVKVVNFIKSLPKICAKQLIEGLKRIIKNLCARTRFTVMNMYYLPKHEAGSRSAEGWIWHSGEWGIQAGTHFPKHKLPATPHMTNFSSIQHSSPPRRYWTGIQLYFLGYTPDLKWTALIGCEILFVLRQSNVSFLPFEKNLLI